MTKTDRLMDPSSETTNAMLGIGVSETSPTNSYHRIRFYKNNHLKMALDGCFSHRWRTTSPEAKKREREWGMCANVWKYRKIGLRWRGHCMLSVSNQMSVVQIATMFLSWLLFLQKLAKRLHILVTKKMAEIFGGFRPLWFPTNPTIRQRSPP